MRRSKPTEPYVIVIVFDGVLVNGSARLMGNLAARIRHWQSGYLFQYAFAMILGLIGMITFWVMLK